MKVHPSDMTAWDAIACRRGCPAHATLGYDVDLSRPHKYHDYTPVPARLARSWSMVVWDTSVHPVDGGPYCPAHDTVSETIVNTGIWEPRETVLALEVLRPGDVFLDLGCQIGWFSLLAAASGAYAIALDAEVENLLVLEQSATLAGWSDMIETRLERIDARSVWAPTRQQYRLVKIDLEGAEAEALARLAPLIEHELVDHLLIEVSPTFKPGDHYPDLVAGLVDAGFEAYLLPGKSLPPTVYEDPEQYLDRVDTLTEAALRQLVAGIDQEDVWFRRAGAAW